MGLFDVRECCISKRREMPKFVNMSTHAGMFHQRKCAIISLIWNNEWKSITSMLWHMSQFPLSDNMPFPHYHTFLDALLWFQGHPIFQPNLVNVVLERKKKMLQFMKIDLTLDLCRSGKNNFVWQVWLVVFIPASLHFCPSHVSQVHLPIQWSSDLNLFFLGRCQRSCPMCSS